MLKASIAAAGLLLLSLNMFGATMTFQSGVGSCGVMNSGDVFTNQCAGGNVTGTGNDYYYADGRDTFDGQGISSTTSPGQLLFTTAVSNLSMDYVLINGVSATFEIFDSAHSSLGTFSDNAIGGDKNASFSWAGSGIAELDFTGNTGVIGVSTLTFDTTSTPEPGTFLLLAGALTGLVWKRNR